MKTENQAMKAILRAISRMKLLTVMIAAVVIGAVLAALLPPLVLEKAVNRLTDGNPLTLSLIFGYFGLLALGGVLDASKEALLTVFGQKITHHLRSELCGKLNRLPADVFVKTEPGVTASRFVGDVDTVETLFTSGIISMFADACKVISIFGILFIKNRGLAILLLVLLPGIFFYTRHVQKRMLKAEKDSRVAAGKVTNHVPETIRCIRTIHSLGKERYMRRKYDRYIEEGYAAIERTNFYDAVYSPVILVINALVVAFVMLLAATGKPAIHSFFGMSVGTAVAVISYISQVFAPIESLGMEIQTIQSAAAGVHRINEFLILPDRDICAADNSDENYHAPCIELKDVSFSYSEGTAVLNHFSLTVNEGEQLTLTGRTGAGKSTIFRLLLGLYQPKSGTVRIYGRDAASVPESEKRRLFGYVEQRFYQVPGTVLQQITLVDPDITREQAICAAQTVGLNETITALEQGYDTPCTPGIFSQGQWQLLSIARAIAAQPKILLLDEITANLDSDTEQLVLNALKNAAENRTVVSISHRMYETIGGRVISMTDEEENDEFKR